MSSVVLEHEFRSLLSSVSEPLSGRRAGDGTSQAIATELFRRADRHSRGELTFPQVCEALQQYLQNPADRYFVALSLAEAEGLRALLHAQRARGEALIDGQSASIALLHGSIEFETSVGFRAASAYERFTARQCLRLFDGELDFSPSEIYVTLRALQSDPARQRERWFEAVRSCRRRSRREWRSAPVARILSMDSEDHLLRDKLVSSVERQRTHVSTFLRARDPHGYVCTAELSSMLHHHNININGNELDSLLNLVENYTGGQVTLNEWLSMLHISSMDDTTTVGREGCLDGVGRMIASSDMPHREGRNPATDTIACPVGQMLDTSWRLSSELEAQEVVLEAVAAPATTTVRAPTAAVPLMPTVAAEAYLAATTEPVFVPMAMSAAAAPALGKGSSTSAQQHGSLGRNAQGDRCLRVSDELLSFDQLAEIVVRLEEQPALVEIWTSRNTMAYSGVSLWAPQKGDFHAFGRPSKQRFCVGHYGNKVTAKGVYERPHPTPVLPEIEDTSVWLPCLRGERIDRALEQYAPHPLQFRKVWQVQIGAKLPSFYAWEPVPPGDSDSHYVSLGMVFTTVDEPPAPCTVRCMHRSLCRPAQVEPQELWNDRGLGGTPGSLWVVNNLQCVWATKGYSPPRGTAQGGTFWELRDWPLAP